AYQAVRRNAPPGSPINLDELVAELEVITQFRRDNPGNGALMSDNKPMFDPSDAHMLEFLNPSSGSGPSILTPYSAYHDPNAGHFIADILKLLDEGKTVILDLGNATDKLRRYFADMLSNEVFGHQERKFVENRLGRHFIQLYF